MSYLNFTLAVLLFWTGVDGISQKNELITEARKALNAKDYAKAKEYYNRFSQ